MVSVAVVVLSCGREGEKEDWDETFLKVQGILHPWDRRKEGRWKRSGEVTMNH